MHTHTQEADVYKACHPSVTSQKSPDAVLAGISESKCGESHANSIRKALDEIGYAYPAVYHSFSPGVADADALFRDVLRQANMRQANSNDAAFRKSLASALQRLGDSSSKLGVASRLFALGMPVAHDALQSALGQPAMEALQVCGMVTPCSKHPSMLSSFVTLFPVPHTQVMVASDFSPYPQKGMTEQMVYAPGMDSLGLVHNAPPVKDKRVIDVCTGSGVQGLTAAEREASNVVLVDRNPRAVRFAQFNTWMNHAGKNVQVVQHELGSGDATSLLAGSGKQPLAVLNSKYDFLLANPPFVPTPKASGKNTWYSSGGGSGEEVLQKVLTFAQQVLDEDGEFAIVTELPNPTNFGDHLEKDLGVIGFSGNVVYGDNRPALAYAKSRAHKNNPRSLAWEIQNLKDNKIDSVAKGYIFGKRGQASSSSPSFVVTNFVHPWTPPVIGQEPSKRPCYKSGLDDPIDGDGCADLVASDSTVAEVSLASTTDTKVKAAAHVT